MSEPLITDELVVGPGGGGSITVTTQPPEGYTLGQMLMQIRRVLRKQSDLYDRQSLGGQGYTLSEMMARVRNVVRDDNKSFVTDQEITDWLNEAAVEVAQRTRSITKAATGVTASGRITLPTDYVGDVELLVNNAYPPALFVDDDEEWNDFRDGSFGMPRIAARVIQNLIELFPAPADGTAYTLRYVSRPITLALTTDKLDLPQHMQLRVIQYARAHAKFKEREFDAGDRYLAMYSQGLPQSKDEMPDEFLRSQNPIGGPREVTDFELIDWLNEAFLEIAWRTRCVSNQGVGTPTVDGQIALPDDFLQPELIRLSAADGTGSKTVNMVDNVTFDSWSDQAGVPAHVIGRIFSSVIELYPVPDVTTEFTMRYFAKPLVLVSAADQTNVPRQLQTKAIRYAQGQAKKIEGDFNAADRYLSEYQAEMPQANMNERRIAGPVRLDFEPGAFDLDPDARHV